MCGITGIVNLDNEEVDRGVIISQTDILTHRGPNDQGIWIDHHVALGHQRLSIIDLETGKQPIGNEDKSMWIICNGEIYNYRELAKDLRSKGHTLSTKSDNEVILHLYEEYQEDCVKYLNGIFAFAIWDKKNKSLFLARDRLGIKPLFYYHHDQKFIFASEIKSILQNPNVSQTVNQEALFHYFSFNYVPSPLTMFDGILSLEAGHSLTLKQEVRTKQYWDLSFDKKCDLPEEEIQEKLDCYLNDCVTRQLVSDVPVGAFLSGGIDSSTIVSLIQKASKRPVKTFNLRFKESSYDESQYARLVADHLNTEHYEVFCEAKDYLNNINDIIWHSDNLTVDISMLPLFLVSKLASEHVKVVLSGDGADELFAGYPTYRADKILGYYQKLPGFLKKNLIPALVERLPVSEKRMSLDFKAKRFVEGGLLSLEEAHYSWRQIFSKEEKKNILKHEFRKGLSSNSFNIYQRFYQISQHWDTLDRHLYADTKVWLADSILSKVDLMSMAHSLEVRVPFLDHTLVEFAATIPSDFKLKKFQEKSILKKTVHRHVPSQVIQRSKAGFNIPIGKWLRNELKDFMMDVLRSSHVQSNEFLDANYIQNLISDHLSFKKDNGYKLLSLLHFCLWYDKFILQDKKIKI